MAFFQQIHVRSQIAVVAFLLGGSPLAAQSVQLPTQQVFSVGTTVLVPDRGAITLGGVSRAREGSVSRGLAGGGPLFQNRGIGREFSKSEAQARVWIIDNHELDQQVLAEARRRATPVSAADAARLAVTQKALYLTQYMGATATAPTSSVATSSYTSKPRPRLSRPLGR